MGKGEWTETYRGCDCESKAESEKDLLGYCGIHGGDMCDRTFIPSFDTFIKDAKALAKATKGRGKMICEVCGKETTIETARNLPVIVKSSDGRGYVNKVVCSVSCMAKWLIEHPQSRRGKTPKRGKE